MIATSLIHGGTRPSCQVTLGVIHRGPEKGSLSLMQSYLSGYAEEGGLYALGLIMLTIARTLLSAGPGRSKSNMAGVWVLDWLPWAETVRRCMSS